MKKVISVLLSLLLVALCVSPAFAAEQEDTRGAYEHVFIIGVDGAGRFFKDANTPNFDRIFADGAVDYTARAETITVSAQNWGAMLTGVSYLKHGMTNDSTGANERSSDTDYPTIFKYVRDAYPDAELASIVNWSNIGRGIIETDINVTKLYPGDDEAVTDATCNYFNEGNAPALFFLQFDSVDHVGHSDGSKAESYIAQIETVDGYIGRIYDTLEANGLMENGLFIVVADHGHTIAGGHGGLTMRETNVTLAVAGKTVKAGGKMDSDTRNRDVAAIALYALGVERPEYMTARLPANLFKDVVGETRSAKNDLADYILCRFAWLLTLCTALF